nr:monooxygenase-like protein [uncultured bacterium]
MGDIPQSERGVMGINVFTIEPENQEPLIECMRGLGRREDIPGLLGLRLLRSVDGKRMINYMHWESEEAFHAAAADPTVAATIQRAGELVGEGQPGLFEVVYVHE